MISVSYTETKMDKGLLKTKTSLKLFKSLDKAKEFIKPIVREMKIAKQLGKAPKIKIDSVSYEDETEQKMLLSLQAIESVENDK